MYIFTKIVCTSTKTNQNTASNKYSVLIGWLWSTCKTPVFETSITIRTVLGLWYFINIFLDQCQSNFLIKVKFQTFKCFRSTCRICIFCTYSTQHVVNSIQQAWTGKMYKFRKILSGSNDKFRQVITWATRFWKYFIKISIFITGACWRIK
jgi:hypothetical protein